MRVVALAALLSISGSVNLIGQEIFGSVSGTVKDPHGSVIAGAVIKAVHADTGAVREAKTDAQGTYNFTGLPVGTYTFSVEHTGFKHASEAGVELHAADLRELNFTLQVGDMRQEVTVLAETSQIQIESPDQGGVLSGDQVREMEVNGRSFTSLLEMVPGVASNLPDRVDPGTSASLQINGQRDSSANVSVDGGNNSDVVVGSSSQNTSTSLEQIAELKIVTNAFAAEYGRSGVGQVNVVTRGGGKQFHGSAYYLVRNGDFNAADYFSHLPLPQQLNNFGYTLMGPVVIPKVYNRDRNKTFFFFNQEFNLLNGRPNAINTTVPTAAMRQADFSALSASALVDPTTAKTFPGNIIPDSRIDPNGVKLANLYPLPNFVGPGAINYTSAKASHQNYHQEMIRIDQVISPTWKLYGRYSQDNANVNNPYGGTWVTSENSVFPGISATTALRAGKNVVLNMTNVLGNSMLNEASANFSTRLVTQTPTSDNANRAKLGIDIPELFPENQGNLIPTVVLNSNYATINVSPNWLNRLYNVELSDTLTKMAGRHMLKAGVVYSHGGNRQNNPSTETNGYFTFNTGFSKNPVANLLLGLPYSYTETDHSVLSDIRFGYVEAFAQDDFRVANRLTLSYGLRVSYYSNPYDTHNVLTNFLTGTYNPATAQKVNPSTSSGMVIPGSGDPLDGIIVAGQNSLYGRQVTNNNSNLLGPRFGFAWDPLGRRKTAVRGGYGIYYTRPLINTYIDDAFTNPPFTNTVTILSPTMSNPGGGSTNPNVVNLYSLGAPLLAPTVQQWSFGVQQEMYRSMLLTVTYVGSHGTHLMRPINVNDPPAGLAALLKVQVNAARPYQGFGSITERQDTACSTYESLQASFNRRMTRRFMVMASYTFSKSIDNSSSASGYGDIPPNTSDARDERGLSSFNRKHVLTTNFLYGLPNLARGRAGRLMFSNWQVSGVMRVFSGNPFDALLTSDVAGIGETQNQRPNLLNNPNWGPHTIAQWFNIYVFSRPTTGTFGNMGRNVIIGPGMNRWDMSLFKNFTLGEGLGRMLQFRADVYNAFNHPSFYPPANSLFNQLDDGQPAIEQFRCDHLRQGPADDAVGAAVELLTRTAKAGLGLGDARARFRCSIAQARLFLAKGKSGLRRRASEAARIA